MAPLQMELPIERMLSEAAGPATPIGFYTIVVSSAIFALTALPTLFKPWDMGVKMYIPLKLPESGVTQKQMTVLQCMFAMCILMLTVFNFVAAFTTLSFYFVCVMLLFYALQMVTFVPSVFGFFGKDPDVYGFDRKMVVPQIVIMVTVLLLLAYSLYAENYPEPAAQLTLQVKILIGFNALLILMNGPGIAIPEKMFEMYAPKGQSKNRYEQAQLALYMQGLAIFNTINPLAGIAYLLTAPDYLGFILCGLPFYFGFFGFFIYFLQSADELGWDKNAMYFWLPYNGIVTGCTIILALDAAGMLA